MRRILLFLLLNLGVMAVAAACTSQVTPEQPTATLSIPGPALVQFFTDP
ncbi:MAG: hypothetical protein IPL78_22840 [Chloroflexi bacterium]|nr:hypothetical protein [Chloroflexota bacterium]